MIKELTMRLTKKEELHNALCSILEEAKLFTGDETNPSTKYIDAGYGICQAVVYYFSECEKSERVWFMKRMKGTFLSWDGFSGSVMFPVGGHKEYMNTTNLWIGESGKKRRSLLNHMISKFSK